jgi:hypothetical protein
LTPDNSCKAWTMDIVLDALSTDPKVMVSLGGGAQFWIEYLLVREVSRARHRPATVNNTRIDDQ